MITPDGRPVGQRGAKGEAVSETAAATAPTGSKLWNPDAPAPAAAGEKKSKIWTPDMG